MFKGKRVIWKGLMALVAVSLLLSACAPAATPVPTVAPTKAAPTAAVQPTAAPKSTDVPKATDVPTKAPEATPITAPTATATAAPTMAAFTSKPSGKTTAAGFACPEPQPKMTVTAKTLNLFVWSNYIPQDILDCFEAVYGIKINRKEYAANEEMLAVMTAGSTNFDLVQPTDYAISPLLRQNKLQKLDKTKLAVMPYYDPIYLNLSFDPGNEYSVPYEAGIDAIVYNADKIKTPPTSWADLWNPDYVKAGRMISLDDSRAVIGATLLILGFDVNSRDPKQLEAARVKLAEMAKGIKLFDSDSPKTALIAGDVDLGIVWTGDVELAHRENPAIQFAYPKEGAIVWQDNYVMPANAPHPDAAYAWINYSMQPDLFWLMLRDFPYTNPNKAALEWAKDSQLQIQDQNGNNVTPADLYQTYINSTVTNPPPDVVKAGHRVEDLPDVTPLYDKIWTEIKGK